MYFIALAHQEGMEPRAALAFASSGGPSWQVNDSSVEEWEVLSGIRLTQRFEGAAVSERYELVKRYLVCV